jgi:ribosomal protein S3
MIQYGLIKLHKKKIRPKNFFYFIDSVLKNLHVVRNRFEAFRVIITGKLRGGTSRTKSFSTGFGVIPNQTLEKNIRYEYGDIRSKYGSFGVKVITLRKTRYS